MKKSLTLLYSLMAIVCLPSLYYWLDSLNWTLEGLTAFRLFPVFGLLAFNIMWFHLMVAWYKRSHPDTFDYRKFFRQTSNIVLALIILHPAILVVKALSINIKPLDYVAPDVRIFLLFGTLAFLIFMSYEIVDRLREKPVIKNNWPIVVGLNRAAMILIFYHALKLGTHLQSGPLRIIWIFFGLSLLAYFATAYRSEILKLKNKA